MKFGLNFRFKKKERRNQEEPEGSDGRGYLADEARQATQLLNDNDYTGSSTTGYLNQAPGTQMTRTASEGLQAPFHRHLQSSGPSRRPDTTEYRAGNGDAFMPIHSSNTSGYGDSLPHQPERRPQPRSSSVTSVESGISIVDDSMNIVRSYEAVPVLEVVELPRGGVSMGTEAVGRVQFGIPPETIKDSMREGLPVPEVYIVPVERFCREMGPALGVNLAEFEFPAYFNFFVRQKRCTLVVDSEDAEQNIRRVFSETLLGPAQFRREEHPLEYEEEDFAPEFDREAIPNFQKELKHFRIMPGGKELVLETLLNFRHFETPGEHGVHENLGIPVPLDEADGPDETGGSAEVTRNADDKMPQSELEEAKYSAESQRSQWVCPQARWIGDVATIWPDSATEEEIKQRKCKRVEIFKMPGGTEYILHDIDENNHIVGKARFSGHVKVSESMGVDGFSGKSAKDDTLDKDEGNDYGIDPIEEEDENVDADSRSCDLQSVENDTIPPTFHPPSFGVTVLGNSHGFDKSGSVSGYVLWINGRGVMIDPPPYSSATLEREGIRPRTIVGIILTHCHADHDAGAFQKVLTGSPVVVITTPTIYKSFIRKYAALSALSPALLRHSHRHKPAIIGRPLRFQGATFHFTYTLHAIPCVGFKVEWRGRSMVFTGDHLNSPPEIDKLQESGVLSEARANDLRKLPLQDTDLLLHESGAPPLHTPLKVLLQLPPIVKQRLYVVHTSALPEDCELRVAPTGTKGTIRLDQLHKSTSDSTSTSTSFQRSRESRIPSIEDSPLFNEYEDPPMDGNGSDPRLMASFTNLSSSSSGGPPRPTPRGSIIGGDNTPPPVSLRPASSTDAWFILNLLSAVPFLTSLSYASTMEVLETARVDAFCKDDVIVPASRRNKLLCVVWEGTCVERERSTSKTRRGGRAVWHAGDWTGPIALQPDRRLSGESALSPTHDVVAMSEEGVKVITVEFSNLHAILKTGSVLYRKYLERRSNQKRRVTAAPELNSSTKLSAQQKILDDAIRNLNVLELLDDNSALRKLSAVQKRHLESLAEGPKFYQSGEKLWKADEPVDKAFIIVAGSAAFSPKRRHAGSAGLPPPKHQQQSKTKTKIDDYPKAGQSSIGKSMQEAAQKTIRDIGNGDLESEQPKSPMTGQQIHFDSIFSRTESQIRNPSSYTDAHDYVKLSRGLQVRAKYLRNAEHAPDQDVADLVEDDDELNKYETNIFDFDAEGISSVEPGTKLVDMKRRSSRARFANGVLGRLYTRQAFSGGLIFSRGHFLGDVSKMVAGLLSADAELALHRDSIDNDGSSLQYGFGETEGGGQGFSGPVQDWVMNQDSDELVLHNTTLMAGQDGCAVLVFPKASLIPFLDEYPGLLLSILGTQVVV